MERRMMSYTKKSKVNSIKKKYICMFSIIMSVCIVGVIFIRLHNTNLNIEQITGLKNYIFQNSKISDLISENLNAQSEKDNFFVVFISICDKVERARVFKGTGRTIELAWDRAEKNATSYIKRNKYELVWAKADIVDSMEKINTKDLNKYAVESIHKDFIRKGIAFDDEFEVAFLEAEISGNKMITYYTETQVKNNEVDYDSILLNIDNINFYRKRYYDMNELKIIPEEIIMFTTKGFFCDENKQVLELYSDEVNCGRRMVDLVDDEFVISLITDASTYLSNLIQPSGQFIYGYYPVFDNMMENYNILRHASSLWSLINLYRITQDDDLISKIDKGLIYLIKNIEFTDEQTAYVIDTENNEVKLGGNGLAIIAMTEYMSVFNSQRYIELVECLANGILELENIADGTFFHVLNYPDYSRKEEFRIIYYDGEATFALTRAYAFTKQEKYLEGARMAVENFIKKDYTKHRDHWVAYSLHEITKYIPDSRYYEFALKNVEKNLDRIYNQPTSYHTYLELLAISWQTYERLLESGMEIEYLDKFNVEYFAETLYKRASHMLNGYFFPEYAMYMKSPEKILDAFFVRHHSFRVRVDDIQHFIGGYYYYAINYEKIRSHLSNEFINQIKTGSGI